MPTKIRFFSTFFAYYFLEVHLHQSSKTKCQKEIKIDNRKKVFIPFFLLVDGRIHNNESIQIMTDPYPGGPKTCGSNNTACREGKPPSK
jgi:hypothetical protein